MKGVTKYILGISLVALAVISLAYFAFAQHLVSPVSYTLNQSQNYLFNISITNNDANNANNITKVSIGISGDGSFITGTNGSSVSNSFVNTSALLTWNATQITNSSVAYFLFNMTTNTTAGNYNITVTTYNTTSGSYVQTNLTKIALVLNDITAPSSVNFTSPSNAGNYSGTALVLNVSASDETGVANVFFNITNATAQVSRIVASGSGNIWNATFNTTSVPDGLYNITAYVNDSAGNLNNSVRIMIRVDNTAPSSVNFTSPSNAGNYSGTALLLNASTSDNVGIANLFFNVTNSTGQQTTVVVASGSGNIWNATFNTTSVPDGLYNITIYTNDSAGNLNNTDRILIGIDNTYPQIIWGNGLATDYANLSQTSIFVNVTSSLATFDANFANITFTLYNSTGLVSNVTYTYANATSSANTSVSWTSLPDAHYSYNVTVSDGVSNKNTTATQHITLDNTTPVVSLDQTSQQLNSISLSVSVSDSTSGVKTCATNRGSISGSGTSWTVTESSLACSTGYSYQVTCTDYAGRASSTTETFATDYCGGGSSNGGSSGSGSIVSTWVKEIKLNDSELNLGQVLKQMKKNYRLTFNVKGLGHSVGVTNVTSTNVTIVVASTPQIATLFVGQTLKFDVDADGYYDIAVKLVSISGTDVNLAITKINEKVPTNNNTNNGTNQQNTGAAANQGNQSAQQSSGMNSSFKWLAILIVIIVVVVIVFIVRARKKTGLHKKVKIKHP